MTISSSYGLRLPQIHHDIHDINTNEMKWNFRTEDKLSMNILVLPGIQAIETTLKAKKPA